MKQRGHLKILRSCVILVFFLEWCAPLRYIMMTSPISIWETWFRLILSKFFWNPHHIICNKTFHTLIDNRLLVILVTKEVTYTKYFTQVCFFPFMNSFDNHSWCNMATSSYDLFHTPIIDSWHLFNFTVFFYGDAMERIFIFPRQIQQPANSRLAQANNLHSRAISKTMF